MTSTPKSGFQPTTQQDDATRLFKTGESMAVKAGAGTGKTSTLNLMAEEVPGKRGQYVAFNKSIVEEAGRKFPQDCRARTAHSLAMGAVGLRYRHRLGQGRMRSDQLGRHLGLDPFNVQYKGKTKVIQPGHLASTVMRAMAIFCNTDDQRPTERHIPYMDGIDEPSGGKRTYENNDRVKQIIAPYLEAAWRDLCNPDGRLPYAHDHYLKLWELTDPVIKADYILFDEAQDASPVMLSIVHQQAERCQLVFVGDSNQAIYSWRGAVDALDNVDTDHTLYLTQSFRFGPEIADVANAILLDRLNSDMRLEGLASIPSHVGHLDGTADCVLTRTNAVAMETVLNAQFRGRQAYLMGGGDEIKRFVNAVIDLNTRGRTTYPDLACFDSWQEVVEYTAQDPQGDELKLLVKLVQDHGVEVIKTALDKMPRYEEDADVVVSTAHKAKGREWDSVRLTEDFRYRTSDDANADPELPAEEWRLLYVACTRAKLVLDPYASEPMIDLLGLDPGDDPSPARLPAGPPQAPPVPAVADLGHTHPQGEPEAHAASHPAHGHGVATRNYPVDLPPIRQGGSIRQVGPYGGSTPSSSSVAPEPRWWMGRCVANCTHAAKLYGTKRFDGERFLGFFDAKGVRVYIPECPTHRKRPFMKLLEIGEPKPGSRCNASCWNAKSTYCDCPCAGTNHGSGHAPVEMLEAATKPQEVQS